MFSPAIRAAALKAAKKALFESPVQVSVALQHPGYEYSEARVGSLYQLVDGLLLDVILEAASAGDTPSDASQSGVAYRPHEDDPTDAPAPDPVTVEAPPAEAEESEPGVFLGADQS